MTRTEEPFDLAPVDAPARPRWPLDALAALQRPTHAAGRKGAKA